MNNSSKSYRIRASVGTDEQVINVKLEQSYDLLEVLSLKLSQEDAYKLYTSSYGVIVGRVLANQNFGIPNAKVSVFIQLTSEDSQNLEKRLLYPYRTTTTQNNDGIRYNLLPDESVSSCHQNVGTFPNKRLVLDNDDLIEIFDTYWKYTTTTNQAGDYMIFGVPTGNQNLHVDIDLSDIGVLSQRPRDMIYKGYNLNQFESPNQFKTSKDLGSLSQIYTQNNSVYVYPFWGDSNEGTIAVTRADVKIEYLFEPTCVFMGSVVTDSNGNAIGKNCVAYKNLGAMDSLVSGEGTIEMIRKTIDDTVEEFQVQGTRLIDGDGVWCYQIPMNLDYVGTDEYGNIVPTDDPTKGIPTRTKVRFRISIDDTGAEGTNRKRGKMLVPNNPKFTFTSSNEIQPINDSDIDYEFGTATKDESYRDLFWNKVYTVKSYIPRLQKSRKSSYKKFIGIKQTNEYANNNPLPFNNLRIQLNLIFRLLCTLSKIVIYIIKFVNIIIGVLLCPLLTLLSGIIKGLCFKILGIKPLCWITKPIKIFRDAITPTCITIPEGFCEDDKYVYAPGCWCKEMADKTKDKWAEDYEEGDDTTEDGEQKQVRFDEGRLLDCVENQLAQENGVFNFDFYNDWVNGVIYIPLWLRKVRKKKKFLFGLIKRKAKVQYCAYEKKSTLKLYQPCAVGFTTNASEAYYDEKGRQLPAINPKTDENGGNKYHKVVFHNQGSHGLVNEKKTMLGQNVYYYRPVDGKNRLFATDIVLLGSLNDCDLDGYPQAFRYLEPTTFNMPPDMVLTESGDDPEYTTDGNNDIVEVEKTEYTEMSGADWGYRGPGQCGENEPSGLFLGIYCNKGRAYVKSCINLQRVCEIGVALDERQEILNRQSGKEGNWADNEDSFPTIQIIPDGYISKDELQDTDVRGMIATLNINGLRTIKDTETGLRKYDLRYTYPINFDGSLQEIMQKSQEKCKNERNNYLLEKFSDDYYRYRMGNNGLGFYGNDGVKKFPLYDNSFYFYFGIKDGNTALDKFNKQFFSVCNTEKAAAFSVSFDITASSWCPKGAKNGSIKVNVGTIETPYTIKLTNDNDSEFNLEVTGITLSSYTIDGLSNSDYTLIVTDANGNTVTNPITLNAPTLSFQTDIEDFKYSYTELIKLAGCSSSDCHRTVYNYVAGKSNPADANYAGGRITVHDVMIDGNVIDLVNTSQYAVEVRDITNYDTTDNNGILPTNGRQTPNSNELIIPTWQGNTTYAVKITQRCSNGVLSDNSTTYTVFVPEPAPLYYTIDDVNFEYIKNFRGGFEDGSFYGWDKIGDPKVYSWPDEWLNPVGELLDDYKPKAEEVIQKMKDTFWLRCSPSSLSVYCSNGESPILYWMKYVPEVYSEILNENIVSPSGATSEVIGLIENIEIPTLVGLDDERADKILGTYGAINKDKQPYQVGMFTGNGAAGKPAQPTSAILGNPSTWFEVHFIDKIFSFKLTTWTSENNLFQYRGQSDRYSFDGFTTGYIFNGIADNNHTLGSATYTNSSLEEEIVVDIDYDKSSSVDENAIPTKRMINNPPKLTSPVIYEFSAEDWCAEGENCSPCTITQDVNNTLALSIISAVSTSSGATIIVNTNDIETPTLYAAYRYGDKVGNKTPQLDNPYNNMSPNGSSDSEIYYSGWTNNNLWDWKDVAPVGATTPDNSYSILGATFIIPADWNQSNNSFFIIGMTNTQIRMLTSVIDFNEISYTYEAKKVVNPVTSGVTCTLDVKLDKCENWYANNYAVNVVIRLTGSDGVSVAEQVLDKDNISSAELEFSISEEIYDKLNPILGNPTITVSVNVTDIMKTLTICKVTKR